ncbi:hypothetical protein QJS66_22595 [Kocuria rhizophila]|nr:hypothetical protein QJS66_22595 [Kocuria rhizophila]
MDHAATTDMLPEAVRPAWSRPGGAATRVPALRRAVRAHRAGDGRDTVAAAMNAEPGRSSSPPGAPRRTTWRCSACSAPPVRRTTTHRDRPCPP